jgi:mono/diheme cytochrome c family protein
MRKRLCVALSVTGVLVFVAAVAAQSGRQPDYDEAYLGPRLADPLLQHSKETYVLFGCAYCHGLNLVPRGEATDLRRSAIVGSDRNANMIGPLLRAGIPQTPKLSPMPQFSDLSEQQIAAIARWIHYARQRARYEELTAGPAPAGNPSAGRGQFDQNCASCHSIQKDLAGIGGKYDAGALREQILDPKRFRGQTSFRVEPGRDARLSAGRERHLALLENFSASEVANLSAYLQSVR